MKLKTNLVHYHEVDAYDWNDFVNQYFEFPDGYEYYIEADQEASHDDNLRFVISKDDLKEYDDPIALNKLLAKLSQWRLNNGRDIFMTRDIMEYFALIGIIDIDAYMISVD